APSEGADAAGGRRSVLCGFDRDDVTAPVRFPDLCETRAWSAAAPLLHLRSLLRFDPHVPQGKLWLSPVLPDAISHLRVERIPLMGGTVTVTVDRDGVEVADLPAGVEVIAEPRRPPRRRCLTPAAGSRPRWGATAWPGRARSLRRTSSRPPGARRSRRARPAPRQRAGVTPTRTSGETRVPAASPV